ncbi:hypothetical protein M427DRAFT_139944 [Gonapodya prolifera JEL478]|uniref:Ribosomal eL28/Mak16 domain-containing protein n=1 Tax=Gonapodya prolifera (strain JEL478) TaxID=1344416 RepID=A0A139A0X6_GONPJ|nr:hypothetical protein M427DRAFT_139944 [Gonapodya prolifera JEL478]|eukprot:KXS10175.1 hypothetical protein M427DRAFT_139944 [Gonapodya prolifera JEL478]
MSADLVWLIIRKNNSFLVKRNGIVLSREPGNLTNTHSFSASGLANPKVLGLLAIPRPPSFLTSGFTHLHLTIGTSWDAADHRCCACSGQKERRRGHRQEDPRC